MRNFELIDSSDFSYYEKVQVTVWGAHLIHLNKCKATSRQIEKGDQLVFFSSYSYVVDYADEIDTMDVEYSMAFHRSTQSFFRMAFSYFEQMLKHFLSVM